MSREPLTPRPCDGCGEIGPPQEMLRDLDPELSLPVHDCDAQAWEIWTLTLPDGFEISDRDAALTADILESRRLEAEALPADERALVLELLETVSHEIERRRSS